MSVSYREWYFQLWDTQRKISIDDDSAKLIVLTADAPTAPTIYSDANGTSVSNAVRTPPRSFVNGTVRFWTDQSVTSVDLSLMTAKGKRISLRMWRIPATASTSTRSSGITCWCSRSVPATTPKLIPVLTSPPTCW